MAANLGVAALAVVIFPLSSLVIHFGGLNLLAYMASMAALAEAAADTVSSEIGQVLGGKAANDHDFAASRGWNRRRHHGGRGTVAGMLAALLVASVACWAMKRRAKHDWSMANDLPSWAGSGVVGLLFDSVVGGDPGNRTAGSIMDAVNFIFHSSSSDISRRVGHLDGYAGKSLEFVRNFRL